MQYGLISATDANVLEKTLSLAMGDFPNDVIHTTEVGIFSGDTSRWIHSIVLGKGRKHLHTAIDSHHDFPTVKPFGECIFIEGKSMEVYNLLNDFSQHLIFIDGNHSFPFVIADFFCYASKVKTGGYMAFHDTGIHIKPKKDFQRVGSNDDPDMFISVRKALTAIGLMDNSFKGWELVFSEADKNDEAGGISVFKKL